MFRILLFALFCGPLFAADGRLPQIVCRDSRGQSFPLNLEKFEMEVSIYEDLAETTLTLTFRNDTYRQLEGDFLLPLPPNANVSGYALEVKGAFREAVAVEKKRAKLAYETIKRRRVDPGIVEKEADNLYRTRIFPILPHSTKRLRISYLEYLDIDGDKSSQPTYRYPFNLTSEVGEISVRVNEPNGALVSHPALEFIKTNGNAVQATLSNKTLSGELTIESKDTHPWARLLLAKTSSGEKIGYLTVRRSSFYPPQSPLVPPLKTPKNIKIFWDASRSMEGTDFTKAYAYLDAFFTKCPEVTAQLVLLRNTAQELETFQIKAGDWSELKKALQAVSYDGASDFPNLVQGEQELTLLISDGKFTRWPQNIDTLVLQQPFVALLTGTHNNITLDQLAIRSGGSALSLENNTTDEAITKSFQRSFHVSSTQSGIKILSLPSNAPHVYRYLIQGKTIANSNLRVAFGTSKLRHLPTRVTPAPFEILDRLSGIATLGFLESQVASPMTIIEHCKKHILASDYTSLIVLERIQDHLEFRIPPPEPELLAQYRHDLLWRRSRVQQSLTRDWARTLRLHRHHFPGAEYLVLQDLNRLETFTKAQKQVFEAKDLDPKVTQALAEWKGEALHLLEKQEKNSINDEWLQEAAALRAKATQLGNSKASAQKTIAISVKGFVKSPGTFHYSSPITLKEAAKKSRPFDQENLSRVALYRAGIKTVYNTLSKLYEDLPLVPGDMVVVEEAPYSSRGVDWFAGPPNPENEPAVVPPPPRDPSRLHIPPFRSDLSGGRNPFGIPRPKKGLTPQPDLIPFALQAMTLHEKGNSDEAIQHLSNLRELYPGSVDAQRIEAFVRASWGETQTADHIYREILVSNPEDAVTTNLLAHLLVSQGERAKALKVYETYLDDLFPLQGLATATILLLDRNNLLEINSGSALEQQLPKDLRIVVTNLYPDPSFAISATDPFGFVTHKNEISPTGVIVTPSLGLWEITDRETSKGTYKIAARCNREQLLEVTIYRNFGKKEETVTKRIIKLPADKSSNFTLLESLEFE